MNPDFFERPQAHNIQDHLPCDCNKACKIKVQMFCPCVLVYISTLIFCLQLGVQTTSYLFHRVKMWHFLIEVQSPPQKREERESKLQGQVQLLHLIVHIGTFLMGNQGFIRATKVMGLVAWHLKQGQPRLFCKSCCC